jgi:hypothetical protein
MSFASPTVFGVNSAVFHLRRVVIGLKTSVFLICRVFCQPSASNPQIHRFCIFTRVNTAFARPRPFARGLSVLAPSTQAKPTAETRSRGHSCSAGVAVLGFVLRTRKSTQTIPRTNHSSLMQVDMKPQVLMTRSKPPQSVHVLLYHVRDDSSQITTLVVRTLHNISIFIILNVALHLESPQLYSSYNKKVSRWTKRCFEDEW